MRRHGSRSRFAPFVSVLLLTLGAGAAEGQRAGAGDAAGKSADKPAGTPSDGSDGKAEITIEKPERPRKPAKSPAEGAAAPSLSPFEFRDTPMKDAVSRIQSMTGLNIILDPELAEANPTISLRVKDMPLRAALNWICVLAGARYVLMDEAIYIVPKDNVLVPERTVVVDVRDLIAPVRDFAGPEFTLGGDAEGQTAIGLVAPDDAADSDPSGELTGLVEHALGGGGADVSVEERNGRLIITINGEE